MPARPTACAPIVIGAIAVAQAFCVGGVGVWVWVWDDTHVLV
jgi:hypothetical protein